MPQYPFELIAQGQAIPVMGGATLSQEQFPMPQPATPGGLVAQVNASPGDPALVGLQNLTDGVWIAGMPDGTQQQIGPGQTVRLTDGMSLQIGALLCSVRRSSGSGTGEIFSPQSVAPQPYYQQAASPQAPGTWPPAPNPYAGGQIGFNNDSGTGATAVLPAELKGFNGGAFLMNWIWAVNMKSYLGLLCLIPYVGLVMAIVVGVKGNEWAWQNRRWTGIEEFKAVQKAWLNWGVGIFIGSLVLGFAAGFLAGVVGRH